jgi:CRP/FNR family transcriptional regulator, cyclic AMP receptor protein
MLTGIAATTPQSTGAGGPVRPCEFVFEIERDGGTLFSQMAEPSPRPLDLRAASLFDIDPELGELLDARQLAEARPRSVVAVTDLSAGPWSPASLSSHSGRAFAVMVVDGLVLREMVLAGSTATELLGPCDIAEHGAAQDPLLPTEVRWSVPQTARIVVLDDRLLGIMRTWPAVGRVLLERIAHREARLSTHRAIAQLPRVDQRLLAFFGHVGERWGRVAAAGVVIPLQLTHETLGRLIGARRPTVSLALKELASGSLLERRGDGSWLLHYEAFARLGAEDAIPAGWQAADAKTVETPVEPAESADHPARPHPPRLSPLEVQALRERIAALRARHAAQITTSEAILNRSRTQRTAAAAAAARNDGEPDDREAA